MSTAVEKLQADLKILEYMATNLESYLKGEVLFGASQGKLPKITLGGYLMRHYRLHALQSWLTPAEQTRFQQAAAPVTELLKNNIVRSEQRAHEEFSARLRQWEAYIRDLRRDLRAHGSYYHTAVEPRAMLQALQTLLTTYPYQIQPKLLERLELLDGGLKGVWEPGEFVWSAEWEAIYPAASFWWLYGRPLRPE